MKNEEGSLIYLSAYQFLNPTKYRGEALGMLYWRATDAFASSPDLCNSITRVQASALSRTGKELELYRYAGTLNQFADMEIEIDSDFHMSTAPYTRRGYLCIDWLFYYPVARFEALHNVPREGLPSQCRRRGRNYQSQLAFPANCLMGLTVHSN